MPQEKTVNHIVRLTVQEFKSLLHCLDKLMEKSYNAEEIKGIVELQKVIKEQE